MFFLVFLLLILISWLLWNICQNTNDALEKQTAIQYEIISLEKRLEEVVAALQSNPQGGESNQDSSKNKQESAVASKVRVSINQANERELTSLPRIGKALAQRIIEQRPFETVEALKEVAGISQELYDDILPSIAL